MTHLARDADYAEPADSGARAAGTAEGLIVVDHSGCIRFSNDAADAITGRRALGACATIFDLLPDDSRDDIQRLLQRVLSGARPASPGGDLHVTLRGAVTVRLRALPLLGKTSGRPVAAALEINADQRSEMRHERVFCRADLVTGEDEFLLRLERALHHHRATGVDYLLCSIRVDAGEDTPRTVRLDRLLMSLRAGDCVASISPLRLWVLLSGCGKDQAPGIQRKLQDVMGSDSPRAGSLAVGTAPVISGYQSPHEWLKAAVPGHRAGDAHTPRRSGSEAAPVQRAPVHCSDVA